MRAKSRTQHRDGPVDGDAASPSAGQVCTANDAVPANKGDDNAAYSNVPLG
jgi:hypothetical protein